MSKEATKKFVENNGFICNKCGKVVVDGTKHKNEEDLCDQCKIADLEVKLAESENDYLLLEEQLENANEWNKDFQKENKQLKQQLAEKEERIEIARNVKQARIDSLELDKKICEEHKQVIFNQLLERCKEAEQDKISFAVDKLVDIQKYISDNAVYIEEESFGREINDFIDNQIKQLKEGK